MKQQNRNTIIEDLLQEANEYRFNDSRHAIEIANKAHDLSVSEAYVLGEKVANLYLADCYHNIGDNEKAIPLLLDSLQFFIKEEWQDLKWMANNLMGVLLFHAGDAESSMDFYDHAIEAASEIDNGKKYYDDFTTKKSMVMSLNNIAENYKILGQYEEAVRYGVQAYEIDAQFEFGLSKGLIVLTLGEIYYLIEEYEKAHALANKALNCLEQYHYTIALADAYKLLALTSWRRGEYERADEYFHLTMDLNEREAVPVYKIDSLIAYSEYLKDRDRVAEAIRVLIEACEYSIQFKVVDKTSRISILLSNYFGELGDYERAFHYTKLHYEYEELHIAANHKNLANSFSIKKKMREIEQENNLIIEKNKELRMQRQSLQLLVDKISIISTLGQKITSTLNMETLMEILYSSVKSIMELSYFAIGLYDEENQIITYSYVMTKGERREPSTVSIRSGLTFAGRCITSRNPVIVNDTDKEFEKYIDKEAYDRMMKKENTASLKSVIFCPLIVNTKIIGIITVQSEEKDAFTQFHVEMLKSLSSYAAIAINNAIKSSELEDLNQILISLSERDQLTGIANRRKFDEYMDMVWNSSMASGSSMAVLMVDVDYYKEYNDNYGHIEGDNCIIEIAKVLEENDGLPHFAARYGGDEFVVIVPNCMPSEASSFGNSIKTKVEALNIPHAFSKVADRVTLSVGVACIVPEVSMTIHDFLQKVDAALYIAKKNGRNQVFVIDGDLDTWAFDKQK